MVSKDTFYEKVVQKDKGVLETAIQQHRFTGRWIVITRIYKKARKRSEKTIRCFGGIGCRSKNRQCILIMQALRKI
jgi:hypothetical protein